MLVAILFSDISDDFGVSPNWKWHFQQYFSYFVAVSFIGEESGGPGENHCPVASYWQTLSHNVVHLALIEIRTDNISDDSHWFHR
jgi:hypothetical protein